MQAAGLGEEVENVGETDEADEVAGDMRTGEGGAR